VAAPRRRTIEVLPSAGRLVNSLRDLGYEAPEAVADLVDNSIAANARNVDITIEFAGADSWIRIADDGDGMNAGTITEAMRYGSHREYDDDDLGRFGLGLKTASMSQCRRLTVASRPSKQIARVEARQLDLDFVAERDAWDILILSADERPPEVVEPLHDHTGTVVLWEDLDRILNYKNPGSEWARQRLLSLAETLDLHLGMVFHRFLGGEVPRRRKLRMTINGTPIEPWDPFARSEKSTLALKAEELELNTPTGSGIVRLEPFVLPPKDSFSSEAAHRHAAGPDNWNRQQGFYIYRANRLIQSGGWSRMRTQDEHTKLARMALLFSPELDATLGINVAKMRVTLPPELKDLLGGPVAKTVARAQAVYRSKPEQASSGQGGGGRPSSVTALTGGPDGVEPTGTASGSSGNRTPDGPRLGGENGAITPLGRREALERAAGVAKERKALRKIIKEIAKTDAEAVQDLGW
jgi:Histidine kinase-, DNA gyrase B-, and HSP90-like ATPase